MGRLDGRVALVTGAARGIGRATALRLASEGARLALADLDEEGCRRTAAEIAETGSEALPLSCDVSDAAQVQKTVDATASHFGSLAILVNNAGIVRDNLIHKMTDEDFDRVLDIHLRGAFLCSQAAQKYMVERPVWAYHQPFVYLRAGQSRAGELLGGQSRPARINSHAGD